MNRQDLENRLRADAERLGASCPPHVRHRVAERIRHGEGRPSHRRIGVPALAGAFAATFFAFVSVWMLWQPSGVERHDARTVDLNAAPVVAKSDRMLASREAALENEWQLLERDLRILRDHVTATFDKNPNS
jgi:hypothetical protein